MRRKITAILMTLALIFGLTFTVSAIQPVITETLTESGTWTVPDGVYTMYLEIIGGGGGSAVPAENNHGNGGGGGGARLRANIQVFPGETFDCTVGAGGSAGGYNGGETRVTGQYSFSFRVGGGNGTTTSLQGFGSTIITSATTGMRSITGSYGSKGGNGADAGESYGGGGGGGGGGDASGITGGASNVFIIGGNGGTGGNNTGPQSGTNGYNYGGGAGGSFQRDDQGQTGQSGAPGVIVISYTQPVEKIPAEVTLSGLECTYDRTPKSVTATTDPPGLPLTITYNGATAAPINAGVYAVVATIVDVNYKGSATGTLIVGKKDLKVTAVATDIIHKGTPVVTVVYDGFAAGDDADDLDNKEFILGTTYPADGSVGTYLTEITIGTASDNNYNFYPLETTSFEVLDVTPPSAPVITLAPDDEWTNAETVSITITSGTDEAGGSGVNYSSCTFTNNGRTRSIPFTEYAVNLNLANEGITAISAVTYDNAGNMSASVSKTMKIDRTNPSAPVITLEPDAEWTNGDAVTVTIEPSTDITGGSGAADTVYTTQFGDEAETGETIYTNSFNITREGITVISAMTYDNAGNASAPAVKDVKIDRTKPTITIADVVYENGDEIYLGYITTGFDKIISYTKTDKASGFASDGSLSVNGSETVPTDEPGLDLTHTLTVTDRAGNSAEITFKYKVISIDHLMKLLAPVWEGRIYKINSNIPVKLQITENGVPVPMSSGDLMFALRMFDENGISVTPVRTNRTDFDNCLFTLSPDGLTYQYNLNTKGLSKGIYTLDIYIAAKVDTAEGLVGTIELELRK
ncbi:MAG: MBG domain-containing protein [Eubacteriales bacterium]